MSKIGNTENVMIGPLRSVYRFALMMACALMMTLPMALGDEPDIAAETEAKPTPVHPFDMRPQPWQRRDDPVLSASTTRQPWCKVVLYSPSVLFKDGKFKMWYVGTSAGSRSTDFSLGYAESDDGIQWNEYAGNPIATPQDIGWGIYMQTPFVMFDEDEQIYKMWFSSATKAVYSEKAKRMVGADRPLGYATSPDGIEWKFHPKPIYDSSRSPCVWKLGPKSYRMWMNVDLARIYEFTSSDGIQWQRASKPAVQVSGASKSCIYPFVIHENGRYYMWYGCHRPEGIFEIFCATSPDGSSWSVDHERAAFPASRKKDRFDGRYTSIPSVLSLPDRYMLYYAPRDWRNTYLMPDGSRGRDGAGVYAHIGVAVIPKK
ncbi:MAG: hypothetical protein CMJ50_02275 [Planctomycetaceae bacterium]|nr:hypothetical protein [Planctomycetaceae bacterium]